MKKQKISVSTQRQMNSLFIQLQKNWKLDQKLNLERRENHIHNENYRYYITIDDIPITKQPTTVRETTTILEALLTVAKATPKIQPTVTSQVQIISEEQNGYIKELKKDISILCLDKQQKERYIRQLLLSLQHIQETTNQVLK